MTDLGRLEPFAIVSFRPRTAVHWGHSQWPLTDEKAAVRTTLCKRPVLTKADIRLGFESRLPIMFHAVRMTVSQSAEVARLSASLDLVISMDMSASTSEPSSARIVARNTA